jgi:outer membrane protein OmpA-like peptidoglycan-associated protein
LSTDEVRRIALEILDALGAAHAAGLVHRDLKPENVFLAAPDDRVKLVDFGIAKFLSDERAGASRTETGALMGTLLYMSPEQFKDSSQVDARSDLWAVGVVIYEMATRKMPFEAYGFGNMLLKILSHPPTPPSAHLAAPIPALDALIARALAVDPAARFQSAAAMAEAARALGDASAIVALPQDSVERRVATAPRRSRRVRVGAVALAALVVAGLSTVAVFDRVRRSAPPSVSAHPETSPQESGRDATACDLSPFTVYERLNALGWYPKGGTATTIEDAEYQTFAIQYPNPARTVSGQVELFGARSVALAERREKLLRDALDPTTPELDAVVRKGACILHVKVDETMHDDAKAVAAQIFSGELPKASAPLDPSGQCWLFPGAFLDRFRANGWIASSNRWSSNGDHEATLSRGSVRGRAEIINAGSSSDAETRVHALRATNGADGENWSGRGSVAIVPDRACVVHIELDAGNDALALSLAHALLSHTAPPPLLFFDKDASEIVPFGHFSVLAMIAQTLKDEPRLSLEVCGHGDKNELASVSKDRATRTRGYLLSLGIDEKRIRATWYGATKPRKPYEVADRTAPETMVDFRFVEGAFPRDGDASVYRCDPSLK